MIRVFLDRQIAVGMESAFDEVWRATRKDAVAFEGYISGETLVDPEDPRHFLVISTWRSRVDWDRWMRSEQRRQIHVQLEPLLETGEQISVFEPL